MLLRIAARYIALFWNSAPRAGSLRFQGWAMIQGQARTPERTSKAILILPIVIAFWFLDTYAFPYLALDRDRFGIYWGRHEWLYVHIVAGMVALLLGPVQLWLGLNQREPMLHRVLGTCY